VSADSYRLLRLFRVRVDPDVRSVTASFLGLRQRTAVFREGLGAALTLSDIEPDAPVKPLRSSSGASASGHVWPVGRASLALDQAVATAFLEDHPRRLRRTRAVLVVQHGQLLAERYASGFDETTRFPGWSMTKSVLGALVGVLVADGRLTLDDRELMPAWRTPDPRADISLEDLLRMRSGLAFREDYADLRSDVIEMLFNRGDTAGYAAGRPLVARPGTVWSYSSGTTNILSAIVRQRVGEADYPAFPRRALFDPLGMASALMEADRSGTFVASSFMLATARDWARFGQLHLQDGVANGRRLLPEGWVRFCVTPTPQSPDGLYGAHWWLKLKPELGGASPAAGRVPPDTFLAIGHEGQTLAVVPSRDLLVLRLGLSVYIDAWDQAAFLAAVLDAV